MHVTFFPFQTKLFSYFIIIYQLDNNSFIYIYKKISMNIMIPAISITTKLSKMHMTRLIETPYSRQLNRTHQCNPAATTASTRTASTRTTKARAAISWSLLLSGAAQTLLILASVAVAATVVPAEDTAALDLQVNCLIIYR